MLYTLTISITAVIQYIYKYKTQANSCFGYERFINSCFGSSTRGERHNSYYANHPQRVAHLMMFKIFAGRDPKKPTSSTAQIQLFTSTAGTQLSAFMVQSQLSILTLFQNPQILRTITSGHDVIHTPLPFPVWGFIMAMVIAHEQLFGGLL